jgi:hypothetical protein
MPLRSDTLNGSDGKVYFRECLIMNREGGNGEKVSPGGNGTVRALVGGTNMF